MLFNHHTVLMSIGDRWALFFTGTSTIILLLMLKEYLEHRKRIKEHLDHCPDWEAMK